MGVLAIEPGFVRSLREELGQVELESQRRVHRPGTLSNRDLVALVSRLEPAPPILEHVDARMAVSADDITLTDVRDGMQAIKQGEVATVILAARAPKLFAKIPGVGTSPLALALMQSGDMPTWVMVAPDELLATEHHIKQLALSPRLRGTVFTQFEGYGLTPDNRLSWMAPGLPDLYPLGNGDVGPALLEAGLFDEFPNVKWVHIRDATNVRAAPDEGLLGLHARLGNQITCEIIDVDRVDGTQAVLASVNGRPCLVERAGADFVADAPLSWTGSMIANVEVLKAEIEWKWCRVRRQVGTRLIVQHERSLCQYTEKHLTGYVKFPTEERYLPARTTDELVNAGGVLLLKPRYA